MRKILFFLFIFFLFTSGPGHTESSYLDELHELAESGNGEAQLAYAIALDTSTFGTEKQETVIKLYKAAARQNLPLACLYLGMKYEFGGPVAKNLNTAAKWYEKAALNNLPTAQYMLGSLYLKEKDGIKAFTWLTLAAEQGYPASDSLLAQSKMLLSNPKQKKKAVTYLEKIRENITQHRQP
jgi:TPR repeat protein